MPTNVPPQYREAEARYRAAKTPEEKLACLEEMLRIMPKHKGTDKLQADLKTRIAKLRKQPKPAGAAGTHSHMVPREGAGQVALLGPPNGGKSSLVDRLTHASPRVAEYPFTTREPLPGMMAFEDVAIQLVDLPPISAEHTESWVLDAARRADLFWLVVDVEHALDGWETLRDLLAARKIGFVGEDAAVPPEPEPGWSIRRSLLLVTGGDREGAREDFEVFRELAEYPGTVRLVSSRDGTGLDDVRRATYEALGVMRIYTKEPGKPPDRERPFTLPHGSTIEALAGLIHKDLAAQFKFARVWGSGAFDGQQVQRDHVLVDGDVVEIHA